jgi:rhodanese-related sulfurtransferase
MTQTAAQMVREAMAEIDSVTPKDAFEEASSNGVVFLDVREPVEWEDHIAGAVEVPRGLLEFAADPASPRHKTELDPARRVIVYCRSGTRAALATLTLKNLGFENVANLEGGFAAWKDAGLPTGEHHADV